MTVGIPMFIAVNEMSEGKVLPAAVRDCAYGQAAADAQGVPFEFRRRGAYRCTGKAGHGSHDQSASTWSDDTSMELAVCEGYRELGYVDPGDAAPAF